MVYLAVVSANKEKASKGQEARNAGGGDAVLDRVAWWGLPRR